MQEITLEAIMRSPGFERLLSHPEKHARLRAEVDTGVTTAYLDAVMKETMRLCPAAPIVVRKLLEPMELGGYKIPASALDDRLLASRST